MKSIIQFFISEEDGVYTAEGMNAPIVTEGRTFEELKNNILDAVKLFFKGETPASLGFSRSPSILTNFELSVNLHGSRAQGPVWEGCRQDPFFIRLFPA